MSINILIVDDSALMRRLLTDVLNECDGLNVMHAARNGKDALMFMQHNQPDVVTLDVEMPIMNGLDTLREIKRQVSIPVIMLSSIQNKDTTFNALELGAEDFVEKPINISQNRAYFKSELSKRIYACAKPNTPSVLTPESLHTMGQRLPLPSSLDALVIGASTGGPKALSILIQSFAPSLSFPVFIVQHMPENFTKSFAHRLNSLARVPVCEAEDNQRIERGHIYLAPGGKHMIIDGDRICLTTRAKRHSVRPSVDYLFESAAKTYGSHVMGMVLTGMGKDGADGCKAIKSSGGFVVTQDKQSSTVYGMPKAVFDKDLSDKEGNLSDISTIIHNITR